MKLLRRIYDMLKPEPARWTNPTPAGAEPVQTEPKTCTSPFLESVKASSFCPFCAKQKTPGDMQCGPCANVHNRRRRTAERAS